MEDLLFEYSQLSNFVLLKKYFYFTHSPNFYKSKKNIQILYGGKICQS